MNVLVTNASFGQPKMNFLILNNVWRNLFNEFRNNEKYPSIVFNSILLMMINSFEKLFSERSVLRVLTYLHKLDFKVTRLQIFGEILLET